MKNLVFDIGGTAIKYGICENDKLLQVNEIPTHASMGGRHVMDTLTGLIRSIMEKNAMPSASARPDKWTHPKDPSFTPTAISLITRAPGYARNWKILSAFRSW